MTRAAGFPHQTQHLVDLRSDTVTRPTEEMFEAMRQAPLGDDVLGDDPTVMRLEELSAEIMGKEQAVFVPSGTMGNQCALASHCSPGDAILVEQDAHILYYEVGGPALIAGVVSWTLPSTHGVMDPEEIERRVLKRSIHTPGTSLLCVENTHNRAGGTVVPLDYLRAYREIADRHGMKIHLDGARVFNAATALGVPAANVAESMDSVTFCLSKALRSPVGSVLCGDEAFIERARLWRKRLGGGLRQSGLLAACGIVSLTRMVERLGEDHERASRLARALEELPGLRVDWDTVQTNIVIVATAEPASEWQARLEDEGVLCFAFGEHRLRLVLHADIDNEKLGQAVEAFSKIANA